MSCIAKKDYAKKLEGYLDRYCKALLVSCDNVGSKQFQDIRRAIRGDSVILMGKNTLIRRCLNNYIESQQENSAKSWSVLLDHLYSNVGIVFTEGCLTEVCKRILTFKIGAPARVGAIAPCDVKVPSGNTGMDPSATSFFQALEIPTKINKGTVEIIREMTVIKTGDRVGSSEAALLTKLGIKPFSYGLLPIKVFEEGTVYDPRILELKDEDLETSATIAIHNIASVSMSLGIPTLAAVPHMIVDGCKNLLAIALDTNYKIPKEDLIFSIVGLRL